MLKSFSQLICEYSHPLRIVTELIKKNAFALTNKNGNLAFEMRMHMNMSDDAIKMLRRFITNPHQQSVFSEAYILGRIGVEGPKIFRPTVEQLAMLEQMTLNIKLCDYVQPFETVIIELPEQYYKKKSAIIPRSNEDRLIENLPTEHEPIFVVIHQDQQSKIILNMVMFSTGLGIKNSIHNIEDCIEDNLMFELHNPFDDSMEISNSETEVTSDVLRSCFNYCLLLDEIGVKKVGPNNPSHYQRLQRYREKERNPEKIKNLNHEIKIHPILYSLNQEVKLYRTVQSHSDLPGDPTGRTVSPHHRRGYYRQQPYGPKNTLRKRKRIEPCFVNAHLFLGEMKDTKVIYTS